MKVVTYIRVLAITVFMIILCAPGLIQLGAALTGGGDRDGDLAENRRLAPAPTFTDLMQNPGSYSARMTAYLNDHFAGRSLMIRAYHKIFRQLNARQSKAVQGIESPWLFLGTDEKVYWQQFSGDYAPSDAQAQQYNNRITALRKVLEAHNIQFLTAHIPNKNRIYPQYVSPRHGQISQNSPVINLDFDVEFEGLFSRLKSEHLLYKKTDSHWTSLGAYHAYIQIMQALKARGADYPILPKSELKDVQIKDFSGDLVSYGGYDRAQYHEGYRDLLAPSWLDVKPSRRLPAQLDKALKQDSPTFKTIITERPDITGPTLVIIGDSFETQIRPFFLYSFARVIRVHHNMGQFSAQDVMAYKPDVVIFMPIDRFAYISAQ